MPASTIVDGNATDRVFQVICGRVQISGLTIQHGQADQGGGLLNSGGQVTLTAVVVANNVALGDRRRRWRRGHRRDWRSWAAALLPRRAALAATGAIALGGGIFNQAGSLSLSKSTILVNEALGGDGGQGGAGATHSRTRSVKPASAATEAPVAAAALVAAAAYTMRLAQASPFPPQLSRITWPSVAKAGRAVTAARAPAETALTVSTSLAASVAMGSAVPGAKGVPPDRARGAGYSTWAPCP